MKKFFLYCSSIISLIGCQTYQYSSDPFIVGMRWFDRGNFKLAKEYWEPLAQKGDCDGQNGIALILYHENLAKPDKTKIQESIKYFRTSADQGHFKSLSALGDLNYCSENTKKMCDEYDFKQNKVNALKFYTLSKKLAIYDHDKEYNQNMIEKLTNTMTQEQIKSARSAAEVWKATPSLCTPRKVN